MEFDYKAEYEKQLAENIKLKNKLSKIEEVKQYDGLTGLLSMPYMLEKASPVVESAVTGSFFIVCVDICDFKGINERFGYDFGDRFLCKVADACLNCVPNIKTQFVSRAGGNIFFSICDSRSIDYNSYCNCFDSYINSDSDFSFEIRTSKGVFVINDSEISLRQAMDNALSAMKIAKKQKTMKAVLFSHELHEQQLRDHILLENVKSAFENREFVPYFQPQIYIGRNDVSSFKAEILCRWFKDGKKYSSPSEFIPLFEQSGHIVALDIYMVEEAARYIREFINRHNSDNICICVNISRLSLTSPDFVNIGFGILSRYAIPFHCIEFEITEGIVIKDYEKIRHVIDEFQKYGLRLSIDDFGVLHSSLDVLQKLKFDVLKIDRNFFVNNEDIHRRNMVIGNIVALAQDLDAEVVAEGIEDIATVEFLRVIGCDYIQGFVYSPPVPKESLEEWVNFVSDSQMAQLFENESMLRAYNSFYRRSNFRISAPEYNELLRVAKIGAWTLEIDEGMPRRCYANDILEKLIGVPHGSSPEENSRALEAGVLPEYLEGLEQYLRNIQQNGSDEFQYDWQYPDGRKMTIRCVGVLDKQYRGNGVRISGFHQDITHSTSEDSPHIVLKQY